MLNSIQYNPITAFRDLAYDTFVSISQHHIINKIREFVAAIFSFLSSLFNYFDNPSQEMNVKPMAMVSVLLLLTIMVFSLFRTKKTNIIPIPDTPQVNNPRIENG